MEVFKVSDPFVPDLRATGTGHSVLMAERTGVDLSDHIQLPVRVFVFIKDRPNKVILVFSKAFGVSDRKELI